MHLFFWFITIVAIYFVLVFVGLRLVVPFFDFKPLTVPQDLPGEISAAIAELENKSKDQKSYLQSVYDFVLDKTLYQWKHTRFKAGVRLDRLFVKDILEIWQTKDFVYCQGINYIAFVLLSKSKFFKPEDVRTRHVFVNFVIHQYLRVKVADVWIDFDPAGTGIRGKFLGTHLVFFG